MIWKLSVNTGLKNKKYTLLEWIASKDPAYYLLLISSISVIGALLLAVYFYEVRVLPNINLDELIPLIFLVVGLSVVIFLFGGILLLTPGVMANILFKPDDFLDKSIYKRYYFKGREVVKLNSFKLHVIRLSFLFGPMILFVGTLILSYIFKFESIIFVLLSLLIPFFASYLGITVLTRKATGKELLGFVCINTVISYTSGLISILVLGIAFVFIDMNTFEVWSKYFRPELGSATLVGFSVFILFFVLLNYKLAISSRSGGGLLFIGTISGAIIIFIMLVTANKANIIAEGVLGHFRLAAFEAEEVSFYGNSCKFISRYVEVDEGDGCNFKSVYVFSALGDEGTFGIKDSSGVIKKLPAAKGEYYIFMNDKKANKVSNK
jgi:hypothetical protein